MFLFRILTDLYILGQINSKLNEKNRITTY